MAAQGKVTVFVVDDEQAIASTVRVVLEQAGFAAVAFVDPLDLLRAAEQERPDIVLSDVMMPGMNGLDLALRLQTEYPSCRVVLFSGRPETSELLEAAREHGYDFEVLLKPVRPQELIGRLRALAPAPEHALAH